VRRFNQRGKRTRIGIVTAMSLLWLSACFPVRFDARMPLPEPLITKMPFVVALRVPSEFSTFTQKEKRWSVNWQVSLGQAQSEGFTRLLGSMFERVILVDSIEAGTSTGQPVRAILEPAIEEYAFVTPRDAGSSFFAVSIKYRMGIYTPEGKLADSWAFTGYGSAPTSGMSDKDSLARATSFALRDAAAKLAVEFRDQEIVRELLPPPDAAATSGSAPPASAAEGQSGSVTAPVEQQTPAILPAPADVPAPTAPATPPTNEPTDPPVTPTS
jgi:hypothetical protein